MKIHLAMCAAAVLLAGCKSAPTSSSDVPAHGDGKTQAKPWTTRFMGRNVLFAEEVRIEGPAGLLDHVVTRPDTAAHDVRVQTLPEGLLQSIRVKNNGQVEIRGQLDQLVIVATRSLQVLERPGDVPVVVQARGDVLYKDVATGQEVRQAVLRIEGR